MADEEKTEEEVIEEENTATEETLDAIDKFDALNDGKEDDSAEEDVDDGDEGDSTEEEAEEEAPEETDDDDSMEAAVDALEKEIEAEAGKSDEQKADEAAKAEEAADKKAAEDAEAAEAAKEEPFDCGLNTNPDEEGELYDEAMVEVLNKQGQAMQDRAKAAEAESEKLYKEIDRQDAVRNADWLDSKFNQLGDSFDKALGKGEFEDLEVGGDQQANRIKVWRRMQVTKKAYANQNKQVPSRNKLFTMAVENLHKTETKKSKTDKETAGKLKKRANQSLGSGSKKGSARAAGSTALKGISDFDKKLDS